MDFYVYVYLDPRKEGCFKYGKDGEFICKTYNPKEIENKYGRRVLRRFHETPSGKEGKIDGYTIQRDKLSEDFLNG